MNESKHGIQTFAADKKQGKQSLYGGDGNSNKKWPQPEMIIDHLSGSIILTLLTFIFALGFDFYKQMHCWLPDNFESESLKTYQIFTGSADYSPTKRSRVKYQSWIRNSERDVEQWERRWTN